MRQILLEFLLWRRTKMSININNGRKRKEGKQKERYGKERKKEKKEK